MYELLFNFQTFSGRFYDFPIKIFAIARRIRESAQSIAIVQELSVLLFSDNTVGIFDNQKFA